jgi:hypothetical protein
MDTTATATTTTPTSSNQPRKNEFLSLTDWETGEPIFLDPSLIAYIQQEKGDGDTPRFTRVVMRLGGFIFLVKEDAMQVALSSGRGFYGPKDELAFGSESPELEPGIKFSDFRDWPLTFGGMPF